MLSSLQCLVDRLFLLFLIFGSFATLPYSSLKHRDFLSDSIWLLINKLSSLTGDNFANMLLKIRYVKSNPTKYICQGKSNESLYNELTDRCSYLMKIFLQNQSPNT
jgi:hypothetical protein